MSRPVKGQNRGTNPRAPRKKIDGTHTAAKWSPERQTKICAALANGMYVKQAAQMGGIQVSTFHAWCQSGREGVEPYVGFLEATTLARVAAEARALQNIQTAANSGQWTASAWILERRFPERWGRSRLSYTDPELVELEKQKAKLEIEALRKRVSGDAVAPAVFIAGSDEYRKFLAEAWGFDRTGKADGAADGEAIALPTRDEEPGSGVAGG